MTADQLLQNIKNRAGLPVGVAALSDANIIGAATEELFAMVAPLMLAFGEDYFTDYTDVTLTGQTVIPIPTRAIGATIRKAAYLSSLGVENWTPLPRIDLRDTGLYGNTTIYPSPCGFYPTSTDVTLLQAPTSGILRLWYSRRPGSLVLDTVTASQHTQVGIIVSVVYANPNTTITLTANTNGWAANTTIDIIGAKPPFKLLAKDTATTTASAGTATILVPNTDLTSLGIAAGDYVTLATTSYVPQIPLEWHSALELRASARTAATLGKTKLQAECLQNATDMETRLKRMSAPRTPLNPRKVSAWRP